MVIILTSGSKVCRFDLGQGQWIFSECKNPEYDFLWKGSKAMGVRVVDLWHVKEPQAEIRAPEQNLLDFSRSMSEVMLMTRDVKKCRKTQQQPLVKPEIRGLNLSLDTNFSLNIYRIYMNIYTYKISIYSTFYKMRTGASLKV